MKIKVIFMMAVKNLWSHKSRMVLTIAGVAIGVSAIIFLVSLGYGLEKLVTQQVASFSAFSVIDIPSAGSTNLHIDDRLIEKINNLGHVKLVAPVYNVAGRIKKIDQDSTVETVVMSGNSDFWQLAEISVSEGTLPYSENEIVINKPVINMIGEDESKVIGQELVLDILISEDLLNEGENGKTIKNKTHKVVGVLAGDKSPIVLIGDKIMKENEVINYSSLKIQIDNPDNISQTREQIDGFGFTTEYIGDTLSEIGKVFSLFRVILAGFGLIALIVAALGTFNTLTISLMERTREIGLFKSLGMKNKDIYQLFLCEAFVIGLLGGLLGLILGFFMSCVINCIISLLAQRAGVEVIQLFSTPITFSLLVGVFSVIVGFLTGWYPSRRAVKIDPLDAMRYE